MGLLRLYVPVYRSSAFKINDEFQAISSGHFYDGKQVFFGYHHLIRSDGSSIQVLKDDYTGFHAGHYPTNCRSIGIAIIGGDLSDKEPSDEVINRVAQITKSYQPLYIVGHGEVSNNVGKTECPGNTFYGENGWKNKLLTSATQYKTTSSVK